MAAILAGVLLGQPEMGLAADQRAGWGGSEGWGGRAGLSSSPDQFVLGVHYDAGEPARNLRFMPNADVGVGDDRTTISLNPDLVYSVPVEAFGSVYAGGTLGLIWRSWDGSSYSASAEGEPVREGHSEFALGVAGVFGCRSNWTGRTVFLDLKIRISDAYSGTKLMIGTNFGRGR
jgi:hypothetical protein